jgi:hypothetical protein
VRFDGKPVSPLEQGAEEWGQIDGFAAGIIGGAHGGSAAPGAHGEVAPRHLRAVQVSGEAIVIDHLESKALDPRRIVQVEGPGELNGHVAAAHVGKHRRVILIAPLAASGTASSSREATGTINFELLVFKSALVDGDNVVAAQVFNSSITSNDLRFDMDIIDPFGPDRGPPAVIETVPAPGTIVNRLVLLLKRFQKPGGLQIFLYTIEKLSYDFIIDFWNGIELTTGRIA